MNLEESVGRSCNFPTKHYGAARQISNLRSTNRTFCTMEKVNAEDNPNVPHTFQRQRVLYVSNDHSIQKTGKFCTRIESTRNFIVRKKSDPTMWIAVTINKSTNERFALAFRLTSNSPTDERDSDVFASPSDIFVDART